MLRIMLHSLGLPGSSIQSILSSIGSDTETINAVLQDLGFESTSEDLSASTEESADPTSVEDFP